MSNCPRTSALAGRAALVTGASAGIGAAAARQLHAAGARVVLSARRRERLDDLAAELDDAEVRPLDVRDADAVAQLLGDDAFDIVLANAGMARGVEPLQEGAIADWDDMIDTNLKGLLHVVRATLPGMIERGAGDILMIGSVAGRQVYPGGNIYCATKHAVRAVYEALRVDAAGTGVRFTTIDPGMVETEFALVRFRGDAERAAGIYAGMEPLSPDDVADAVVWAVTRPPHVNVGELVLWPTAQASTTIVTRD